MQVSFFGDGEERDRGGEHNLTTSVKPKQRPQDRYRDWEYRVATYSTVALTMVLTAGLIFSYAPAFEAYRSPKIQSFVAAQSRCLGGGHGQVIQLLNNPDPPSHTPI